MALPQTPFEARGRTGAWTTLAQERTYFSALLSEAPEIAREHIGHGAGGAEMYAYRFGAGPRRILFIAQQHGAELAGREAMLTRIRDWATSGTSAMQDYLGRATVIVVPTAHPDNLTVRNNPNGVNVNREHVRVQEPEALAIQQLIREYQPEVIADLHEAIGGVSSDVMTSHITNPNAYSGIVSLSDELEQEVRQAVESQGDTWEPYWNHRIVAPEYLHNAAGLRHAVGILIETRRYTGVNSDSGDRYQRQLWAVDRIRSWHDQNMTRIQQVAQQSRISAARPHSRVTLLEGENATGPVVSPAPDGYRITASDRQLISNAEDAFALSITGDSTPHVHADHQTRWLVHHLMDPASPQGLIVGARWYDESSQPSVPPVAISGVAGWIFQIEGVRYNAHQPGQRPSRRAGIPAPPPDPDPGPGPDPEDPTAFGMVRIIQGEPTADMTDPLVYDDSASALYERQDGDWSLSERYRLDPDGKLYERTN